MDKNLPISTRFILTMHWLVPILELLFEYKSSSTGEFAHGKLGANVERNHKGEELIF